MHPRFLSWRLVPFLLLTVALVAGCQAAGTTLPTPSINNSEQQATPVPTKPLEKPAATPSKQDSQSQGGKPVVKQYSSPPPMTIDPNKTYTATLHTTMGDMHIELFPKDAPKTVNNFVFLARDGFYKDVKFHRIIKGFMVQTGDPTGTGAGGPGYKFEDEPVKRDYKRGIVAMANAGPNTNGSQFFIMHADYALPKNYTIFGQVTGEKDLEVLDKIANVPVKANPATGEMSAPTQDILITSVDITEK